MGTQWLYGVGRRERKVAIAWWNIVRLGKGNIGIFKIKRV